MDLSAWGGAQLSSGQTRRLLHLQNKKEAAASSGLCFSTPLEMGRMDLGLD